ncbi:MAG: urease accessory UreF family protein, partial [Pseudomonadota bacterium]
MAEPAALLLAWLSPGYPVGAYTYSHGLEHAVAAGDVTGPAALSAWIADCLEHGAGRTDAILLAGAMRAPEDEALAERARALAASRERLLESEAQGAAFATVTAAARGPALAPAPYPVAFGRAAAAHGIAPALAASLYLQAFAANLVSA